MEFHIVVMQAVEKISLEARLRETALFALHL